MKVTQISIGRFHHFHLARQLEKHKLLSSIWTGYPSFKLKDEQGIDRNKIKTFPWLQAPYMMKGKIGLGNIKWLNRFWEYQACQTLDKFVAKSITERTILIALSSVGLYSGARAQEMGGFFICDRGSSHIRFQNTALTEEYSRWGFNFPGVNPKIIEKEESEYEISDLITVPSEYVRQSFIKMGVPEAKISKVTYGARLDRFSKVGEPILNQFQILWVGAVSLRKGFMYLLKAFQEFKHPNKNLVVVGQISEEIAQLLSKQDLTRIKFLGQIANSELPSLYSTSTVFVLPSIEEGLAMVQGEALACGCPVISTPNAGADDLYTDGIEGFIVSPRSSDSIREKFEQLADDHILRNNMSDNALKKVRSLGGWDAYGNAFAKIVTGINANDLKSIL